MVAQRGRVLILPHNDPDPDAIASAVAMHYIFQQTTHVEGQIGYQGIVGRAENRALVRYLNYPLRPLGATVPEDMPIVLVDTQPGAGNNPWQPALPLIGVIDHHPRQKQNLSVPFVDLRPELGATATIMVEYFMSLGLDIPAFLATALFYGIKTDTRGLSRGVSPDDATAYFYLQPRLNVDALAEIERAQVPATYFKIFVDALETTKLYNSVAITHVGEMMYPDMTAEVADLLVRLQNVEWVICTGIYQNKLMLAVRAPSGAGDAGKLVQLIVQADGTAGGHDTMAGGQITIKGASPAEIVARLQQRVWQAFNINPQAVAESLI
ncbi:MAG: manganese-dependent inorganic pyrophosphatase [Anaerolineae bacterium]|nr:manganese-dependent inorganic pyrophosphatase [Anaerolineae bacterium]